MRKIFAWEYILPTFSLLFTVFLLLGSCQFFEKKEAPAVESLEMMIASDSSLLVGLEAEAATAKAAINISCRDCTYNLSGRAFPIDSIRRGETYFGVTLQYYIIDQTYNFRAWVRTPGANNTSVFVDCDYSEEDFDNEVDPCTFSTQIIPLEGLVKIAVVGADGDVVEFYPSGYTGSGSNITFYYGDDEYQLQDPFVVLVCP